MLDPARRASRVIESRSWSRSRITLRGGRLLPSLLADQMDQLGRFEREQPPARLSIEPGQIDARSRHFGGRAHLDARHVTFATNRDAQRSHLGRIRAFPPEDLDLDPKTFSHGRRNVFTTPGDFDRHRGGRIARARDRRQDERAHCPDGEGTSQTQPTLCLCASHGLGDRPSLA